MTISGKNIDIIQKLKAYYLSLNWFMKLFFPGIAAEILGQLSTNSTAPITLESGHAILSVFAKSFSFRLWALLWLPEHEFQHLKMTSDIIVKKQLSDIHDTHIFNKIHLLLVCKKDPDLLLKIYSILQSVDLITPCNLDLISSHANLAHLLMILECLQQFHILTQNNIDTFAANRDTLTNRQGFYQIDLWNAQERFYQIEVIKLLDNATIDNTMYREAILLCDNNYSTYLAAALTFLHQANKLPLGDNSDDCFYILMLFKDIIIYLKKFDVIEVPGGYYYPPGIRSFIMENLSTIAHHSNPELVSSIFAVLLSITNQTQMGRALFSQQCLNTIFHHPDLHSLKAALTCLGQSRAEFSFSDFDMLLTHSHLLHLITIMQVLAKYRLLTSENLNKLLSHRQPEGIHFDLAHARGKYINLTQTEFDTICNEAYETVAPEIPDEVTPPSLIASDILEQDLPEGITDTTIIRIGNLEQYPELLSFIQATNCQDRARFIGSLKQYYRIHLTILNGRPEFLNKLFNSYSESLQRKMQEDGYKDFVTPMEICVILGLRPAMLALYMHDRGSPSDKSILSWSIASGHIGITKSLLSLPQFMDLLINKSLDRDHWDRCLVNWLLETALEGQHFLFKTLLQYPLFYREFTSWKSPEWLLKSAVGTGKVSVLNYLLRFENIRSNLPEFKRDLYRESIKIDSVEMFERLREILIDNRFYSHETANKIHEAIQSNSLRIINYILASPHFSPLKIGQRYIENLVANCMRPWISDAVRTRLLQIPAVFSCAEKHDNEYNQQTVPFITDRLQILHAQKSTLETQDIHAVFDVDVNEAQLLFYILRNLIRRNSPESHDEIRFLLNIPAVKLLAHTAVTPNEPNELIRFAITTGNQEAAAILLTIPAVRELASEHNFYPSEVRGHVDLRALAQDRESSMRALSTGEQRRLSAAIERYQPIINAKGVEPLFQELITQLIARYEAHPAQAHTDDRRVIDLPTSWEEWCKIRATLSVETQKIALLAYYKHKDHTALRYLSRPNGWLASHALYVDHVNRCATFVEYKPLITMLYLAACDKDIDPIDEFTLETRLEHFIDELAHLGRAHNWDHTRIKTDADNNPLLDKDGNIIVEEFDDGEGDKPSCYSGVKRRLLQSVLGHPLLKILTLGDIKQEIRYFVREYFKRSINYNNRDRIQNAWDNLCETGVYNETTHAILNELNVPLEIQTILVQRLSEKYPTQFNDEPSFKIYIETSFQMNKIFPIHLMRFAAETSFDALIQAKRLTHEVQQPPKMISDQDIHGAKICLTPSGH